MKSLSDLIESSRRRDEAAIKGPWFRAEYTNYSGYSLHAENAGCVAERWQDGLNKIEEQRLRDTGQFIAKARTSEPLFREIAAVAVEAIKNADRHCEAIALSGLLPPMETGAYSEGGFFQTQATRSVGSGGRAHHILSEALSKIQSLIDEAEKK